MIIIFKNISTILPFLSKYKKQLIIGPTFKLIEAIFELIVPIIIANMIDIGVKNKDINYIIIMGIVLVVLGIVGLGCALICQYSASVASQGVGTDLRNSLYSHILSLSLKEQDDISKSKLLNNVINDVNQVSLAVAMLIRLVIRAPFLAIGATVLAMILNFKLSLIILVAICVISIIIYIIMKLSVKYFKLVQSKLDTITKISRETLSGIRVIKALNKEQVQVDKFVNANDEMVNTTLKVSRLSALLSPLISVVMNIAIVSILIFGGIFINSGEMSQGNLVALINYITQITLAVVVVSNLVTIFSKAYSASTRIQEVFSTKNSQEIIKTSLSKQKDNNNLNNIIDFNNVSFSYNDNNYVLDELNFSIKKGEIIGIIGATGSGKSSLLSLITRMYDVSKGEIKVFNRNIKEYNKKDLLNKISTATQSVYLFKDTIKNNIKAYNNEISDEEVYKGIEIACADDFVKDINKTIEANGRNFSGGQKGRINIARCVVKKSDIFLFDDSFNALDYKTEKTCISNIKEYLQGKTIIIVSQRIRTLKNTNKIMVLSDGKIVGFDAHENLLANCNEYIQTAKGQDEF